MLHFFINPIFGCIIVFIVLLTYKLKKHTHIVQKQQEDFWSKELAANTSRKKSLDSLHYITIPLETLPLFHKKNEKFLKYEEELEKLSQKKIVNFSGITNTDLKLEYGAANLPLLTEYDQNYTDLVRLLHQWGTTLSKEGFTKEAIRVLEFGIECGTDISGHYKLLCSLYQQENTPDKIQDLVTAALQLNTITQKPILSYLMSQLSPSDAAQ